MGIGMMGAILGGAAGGWGKGQMEAIKAKREEQLANLDRQFRKEEGDLNRAVQEKQITSQEKLTTAQLGVTRELGLGQIANAKAIAELGETGANARAAAGNTSAEKIAQLQTDSAKTLADMQIKANIVPTYQPTAGGGGTWLRSDGKGGMEAYEILGKDGKPLEPLITKDDPPAVQNHKYLMSIPGMTNERALKLAFPDAGTDSMTQMVNLYKANLEGEGGDFSQGVDDAARQRIWNASVQQWKNINPGAALPTQAEVEAAAGAATGPAAAAPAAGAPAAEGAETAEQKAVKVLAATPRKDVQTWAAGQVKSGKSRAYVRKMLVDSGHSGVATELGL